jgi:hypothetical protein
VRTAAVVVTVDDVPVTPVAAGVIVVLPALVARITTLAAS